MPLARSVKKIACIGEVMIELSFSGRDTANVGIAGDTYNTAYYLARRLGADVNVSFVSAVGIDPYSERIVAHARSVGIDTSWIARHPKKLPGIYAIETGGDGERSFAYWRSDSAARTLFSPDCSVAFDALEQFDLVFLSGISIAILPEDVRDSLFSAIDQFRASGGLLAYDSNYRPRLWANADAARAANAEMWRRTDIALPSVDDEMAIFGDVQEADVLDRFGGYGISIGALKRGGEGPLGLVENPQDTSFAPAKSVVDTTAAGDSFNAGYIAALVLGQSQAEALMAGHELASRVIGFRGALAPE